MDKPSFFTQSFRARSAVLMCLAVVMTMISGVALSQDAGGADGQEAIQQLIQEFLQAGKAEYESGKYQDARDTLQIVQVHESQMSQVQREHLRDLLKKTSEALAAEQSASDARAEVQKAFNATHSLILQNRLEEARAEISNIQSNRALTLDESLQIGRVIRTLDERIRKAKLEAAQTPTTRRPPIPQATRPVAAPTISAGLDTTDLYYRSLGFYTAGKLQAARIGFLKVIQSGDIPPAMSATIKGYIADIDSRLGIVSEPVVAAAPVAAAVAAPANAREAEALFGKSVALYREGRLQEAREGFRSVVASGLYASADGNDPQDYLDMIESVLSEQASAERVMDMSPGEASPLGDTAGVGPETALPTQGAGEGGYIEEVRRRMAVRRDFTKGIVADAAEKSKDLMAKGEFDQAMRQLEDAEHIVARYQVDLGDILHKQYSDQLTAMKAEVSGKQAAETKRQEAQQRLDAAAARQTFRDQMEVDRQNRIAELMENALAYQQQGRYEAALGQIMSLLAIEPMHDAALTLKDSLEDMIYFRKQLEINKERAKQQADILLETDKSGIPYADDIVYAKNWKEIIEKPTRRPDEPIGLDPEDQAVYQQLDTVVDLSSLSPEMALADALETIRNSVQPPLNLVPLWRDLYDNAEVEQTTPIDIDGLPAVRLGTALQNLLQAVSGGFAQIGYVVENGVITIATVDSLPSKLETRVYDITDLAGEPSTQMNLMRNQMYSQMAQMMTQSQVSQIMSSSGGGGGYGGGGGGGYGGGGYGGGGYGGGGYGGGMGGMGMMGGMGGMGGMGMMGGMGGMGMMGGMGGMGMMGGMGGGGYGGGGYGGGGYGGGGTGGGSGGRYGGYGSQQAQSLVDLVMETIDPDSWFELSDTGEGTIMLYPQDQPKKLAVLQTRDNHKRIEKLLMELRKALGYQVAIETRFLVVGENFLEDIGLDVDFQYAGWGGKWGVLTGEQNSANIASPDTTTKVPGNLGDSPDALNLTGGYGSILDDLQVSFMLRATQAHSDSKALTAPKVTVLSGETASFGVTQGLSFVLPPNSSTGTNLGQYQGGGATTGSTIQNQQNMLLLGTSMYVTPIISHDKKNVLLSINTQFTDLLRFREHHVEGPVASGTGPAQVVQYSVSLPEAESSMVSTRVSVPDSGTLLLGGQKVTAEVEKEAGVPILGKVPVLGRLFRNRTMSRDHKILLILVKPTIILQEEKEAEALAALEGEY